MKEGKKTASATTIETSCYLPKDLASGCPLPLRTGAVIPVNKPLGWTSFDVVNKLRITIRRHTGLKHIKVGHAGTLDPRATGVLVLCTGRATKMIESLMDHTKEYLATIKLGATTPSFDTEYDEDATYPYEHITPSLLEEALGKLSGEVSQRPPLFSAVQLGGVRAYDLARQGASVELPAKTVTIHEAELLAFEPPYATLRIACSRGTYIRALARDLGALLQSGAYLTALTRTRSGSLSLSDCFEQDDFDKIIRQTAPEEDGFEPLPNFTSPKI